jgi:predicted anti-sigma-YlaC factor YlaD
VSCTVVREALPEFALGVAGDDEVASIELHVETCAACRKEAIDLQRAAAAFGYALAPTEDAAPELEDRVIAAVRAEARPARPAHVRGRRAGTVLLAAALAVAAIGVGGVFAGRAENQRAQEARAAIDQQQALERLGEVARGLDTRHTKVLTGMLAAPTGSGSGAALTLVSPTAEDQLVVIVNALDGHAMPLSVSISDASGHRFGVGEIKHLDTAGAATFSGSPGGSLKGFVDVTVSDAKGRVVLRGTVAAPTGVTSPSP